LALPYSDADPLELYRYLPTFIRRRDELAGLDNAGEAVLQKLTYMLEKESGAHVEMIRRLIVELDVDNCDPSRFNYLGYILGIPIPGDWTDARRRMYLKQLPNLLKIKGTHLNFSKQAAFHQQDVWLVELWKTQEREYRYYAQSPFSTYHLKSARVDMLSCATSCESICESICEHGVQLSGDYVRTTVAQRILDQLGEVLPVHVVLRRQTQFVERVDSFYPSYDTLGCISWCQSICEGACTIQAQSWPGSYLESDFDDEAPQVYDSWSYETTCITLCESICQTCCECGQEGTCETLCEVTCQAVCEAVCQSTCMTTCQSIRQTCLMSCEITCEAVCEPTVE